eukprot:SM000036S13235  [mRNA]  locus=s36:82680:83882:- [translate_table: standard]
MSAAWREPGGRRGRLYALQPPAHTLAERLPTTGLANGLAWSTLGTAMFFVDTALQVVDVFDFDGGAGTIANRRTVVSIPKEEGQPDGMAIDAADKLWVTLGESGTVRQYDPETGREIARIRLPVQRPTSCAFGGADLSELYVTTREEKGESPSQHAGGLFRCHLSGTKGASFAVPYSG